MRPVAVVSLSEILVRWDALSVRWHLDDEERATLLGGGATGPVADVRTYEADAAERRMRLLIELNDVVTAVFADADRVRAWLRRPNQGLGGGTPIAVLGSSPEWIVWITHSLRVAM